MFLTGFPPNRIERWNQKAHTERDAYAFCKANKVHIVEDPQTSHGMFVKYRGYDFILITPGLTQMMRTWILWHEIGHYLLHEPAIANFSRHYARRSEREANFIAAVALIPRALLHNRSQGELVEMDFPLKLIDIRHRVYDATGI